MEKNKPYFSIIIPIYNLEKHLKYTINSVLNQNFEDYEIIVINDGSTDNSENELIKLANQDNRIKIYNQENKGVSGARNRGLRISEGQYVIFLDGDDTLSQGLLQIAYHTFETKECDMFCFAFSQIDGKGKIKKEYSYPKYNEITFSKHELLKLYLQKRIKISICSVISSKKVIEDNELMFDENTKIGEDIEFLIKLFYYSFDQIYSSNSYLNYYCRQGSASNSVLTERDFTVYKRLEEFFSTTSLSIYFNQYLNYWFVYEYFNIIKNKSDKESLENFLEMDYVLEKNKFKINKYGIATFLFKMLYDPVLKDFISKKAYMSQK